MKPKLSKWIILGAIIAIPSFGLWMLKDAIFSGGESSLPSLAVISEKPIPDFSFINQNNEIVTNEYYEGKIYIANFIFTRCPTICMEMSRNVSIKLQRELSRYDNVYFLSHTINPQYDTPEVLREYANRYKNEAGADLSKWNFVTGKKSEIYKIAESYLTYVSDEKEDKNYERMQFAHSEHLVLIDSKGRIRSGFDLNNNVFGAYDGLDAKELKFLVRDVGMLVSEMKREMK